VDERPLKAGGREAFRRWVNEKAYRGLQPTRRIYCISVVQHSVPILCRRKEDADLDAVIRASRPYIKTSWSCS